MGLYVNGQTNHDGALYSFSVVNHDVGSVTSQHVGWEFAFGDAEQSQGIEFGLRGKLYQFSKVPALVYNAAEEHLECYNRKNANVCALVIGGAFIQSYLGDMEQIDSLQFRDPVLEDLRTIDFVRSAYLALRTDQLTRLESVALTESLILEAIESIPHNRPQLKTALASERASQFLFKEILSELHRSFTDVDFDLDRMALELGVTKFHMIRTTKRFGGFTPYAYLLKLRLLRGRELIRSTQSNIADIASASGFEDISTFNKAFKRHFHCSPSAMRKVNP